MFLMGILSLALGLLVYRSNTISATNRHFLILCLSIFTWLCATGIGLSSGFSELALRWFKIDNIGVMFISVAFYAFSVEFLQLTRPRSIRFGYSVASLFVAQILFTDEFVTGTSNYWWGYYPRWGRGSLPFFVVFFSYMTAAFVIYFQAYRTVTSPIKRNQIIFVLSAFLIAYTGSVDFLPVFGYEVYPFGYVPILGLLGVITYAILRYRLLDVSIVVNKGLAYLGFIPFYILILLLLWAFTDSMQYVLAGIMVCILFVFAGLLVHLKPRIEQVIQKTLFKSRYDAYEMLTDFSKAMVTILDLKTLSQEIISTLSKVIGIEKISLFLIDKEKDIYNLEVSRGIDKDRIRQLRFRANDAFPQYLQATNQIIVKEEFENVLGGQPDIDPRMIVDTLSKLESELCIPLINKERLIGILNLGHKPGLTIYSQDDLNLLFTLAHHAAVALDNALLYEDLRRQQTLIRRTDRLRSLETIASGFAHEIRNPLTSIKTFIQLAPDRRDDSEFMGEFSAIVNEDVLRIERLIEEILDYARYMEPKFTEEDLNEVVKPCLHFVEIQADQRSITIEKDLAEDLPRMMLDRQQIKQVLMNLILNALDAMGDTGGRLTVKTHRLTKPTGDGWVQIEVVDTGCGIPAADIEHIFDPFYTTKYESEEREGTGLGLVIVHQIIQEHGGYVDVVSEVGKGTTFFVNLPVSPVPVRAPRAGSDKQ